MGFRTGAYATVWEIIPTGYDSFLRARISVSRKNRDTGEYETDFSGYVGFYGTAICNRAMRLKPRQRIKLGDVDVSTKYDKEKKIEYTNYKIFSYEDADAGNAEPGQQRRVIDDPMQGFDDIEEDPDGLPF